MRYKVYAHGSLWIAHSGREIRRLIGEIDDITQLLPRGFPHARALVNVSPSCKGAALKRKLDVPGKENFDWSCLCHH